MNKEAKTEIMQAYLPGYLPVFYANYLFRRILCFLPYYQIT